MENAIIQIILDEMSEDMLIDEEEEDWLLTVMDTRTSRNAVKNYWEVTVPSYSEKEFREAFRVNRNVFNVLLERFVLHPIFTSLDSRALSADKHIGIFLWFAAHEGCSFRDIKDRFNVGLGSVHNVIVRVTYFISSLAEEFIKWPTIEEKTVTANYFKEKTQFPNVFGCIDGTHIEFDPPKEKEFDYINRKKVTTVQAQAICDHRKKIIDFFVGFPGKVHDARVFKNSDVFKNLSSKCEGT